MSYTVVPRASARICEAGFIAHRVLFAFIRTHATNNFNTSKGRDDAATALRNILATNTVPVYVGSTDRVPEYLVHWIAHNSLDMILRNLLGSLDNRDTANNTPNIGGRGQDENNAAARNYAASTLSCQKGMQDLTTYIRDPLNGQDRTQSETLFALTWA